MWILLFNHLEIESRFLRTLFDMATTFHEGAKK